MGLRSRLRKIERRAAGDHEELLCRGCGKGFRVDADTDLEYLAYEWCQETGYESHRPTPPDVFLIAEHEPHGEIVYEATGEPWPEALAGARKKIEEARRNHGA